MLNVSEKLFSALDIAFGSLYKDDVLIKPTTVINVLAAATLLSLVSCLFFGVLFL